MGMFETFMDAIAPSRTKEFSLIKELVLINS